MTSGRWWGRLRAQGRRVVAAVPRSPRGIAAVVAVAVVAAGAAVWLRASQPPGRAAHAGLAAGGALAAPAARGLGIAPDVRSGAASSGGAVAAAALPAQASSPVAASGATTEAAGAGGSGLGNVVVRRVEENASISLQVKDVQAAFDAVSSVVQGLGGYVQSSTLLTGAQGAAETAGLPTTTGGTSAAGLQPALPVPPPTSGPFGSLVLAVPQAQLQACLAQMEALGKVLQATASGQDVTQQYVDLQARITALEAERQSYLTLLGKATSIGDILQIQSSLTGVQTQLEDLQGQQQALDTLTAMAYVTVVLQPVPAVAPHRKPAPAPSILARLVAALGASARSIRTGATDIGLAVAWCLPWAALAGLGYGVYWGLTARGRARA